MGERHGGSVTGPILTPFLWCRTSASKTAASSAAGLVILAEAVAVAV
jgi:hypothetical protein